MLILVVLLQPVRKCLQGCLLVFWSRSEWLLGDTEGSISSGDSSVLLGEHHDQELLEPLFLFSGLLLHPVDKVVIFFHQSLVLQHEMFAHLF